MIILLGFSKNNKIGHLAYSVFGNAGYSRFIVISRFEYFLAEMYKFTSNRSSNVKFASHNRYGRVGFKMTILLGISQRDQSQ